MESQGFGQYIWNKLAAIDEVQQGNSPLNNDGSTDQEVRCGGSDARILACSLRRCIGLACRRGRVVGT